MATASVTNTIPTFQFTIAEKAALATALALLVASQVFPQLSNSYGWVNECGPTSLVLGTALAGAAVMRASERQQTEINQLYRELSRQLAHAKEHSNPADTANNAKNALLVQSQERRIKELEEKITRLSDQPPQSPSILDHTADTSIDDLNNSQAKVGKTLGEINGLLGLLEQAVADEDGGTGGSNALVNQFKQALVLTQKAFAEHQRSEEEIEALQTRFSNWEAELLQKTAELRALQGDASQQPKQEKVDQRGYQSA